MTSEPTFPSQVCKVCSQFKRVHSSDWPHEFEPTKPGEWVYAMDASTPYVEEWVAAPDGMRYTIHEIAAVLNESAAQLTAARADASDLAAVLASASIGDFCPDCATRLYENQPHYPGCKIGAALANHAKLTKPGEE